jgi:hypothetical protein
LGTDELIIPQPILKQSEHTAPFSDGRFRAPLSRLWACCVGPSLQNKHCVLQQVTWQVCETSNPAKTVLDYTSQRIS